MGAFSRRLAALIILVVIPTTACYKVVPVSAGSTAPLSQVVLEFTDAGGEQLGGLLGNAIASARGRAAMWTADTVTLAMLATTTRSGAEQFWHGERVAIPRSSVARVHERRIDRGRTTLFVLGGLVLAVAAQQIVRGNSSGNPRPPVLPPEQ